MTPPITPQMLAIPGRPIWAPADGAKASRLQVEKALRLIQTATGSSALARMEACHFRIQWSVSWVQPWVIVANNTFGLREGDSVIQVIFTRKAVDPALSKDNLARWFVKRGRLEPDTGWAKEIQLGPYPINRDGAPPC